jgi:DNA-binding MarR family transcriptional regulator
MKAGKEHLLIVIDQLIRIRNESSRAIFSECGLPDITVRQAGYLQAIDREEDVTFSGLAAITRNSKPTVTEMINRFESMGCVYRERCPYDGRVIYIRLTDKGRRIARVEEYAVSRLIERMMESLDDQDTRLLIEILKKVR